MAVTIGELKEIIKNVPDDYICVVISEDVDIEYVVICDYIKTIDFQY